MQRSQITQSIAMITQFRPTIGLFHPHRNDQQQHHERTLLWDLTKDAVRVVHHPA